ncbi:MAG: adenylyl-sulfate reductase subunit alpha [Eubacteriales bacterium]|nr:adenylyl-sulfate reductase subunit alpha [Eubacteriales bacterium]
METRQIETDVLIIGGGTAGCFAAITLGAAKDKRIVVAEKANIKRSGCLAAGVNALNAYITEGRKPEDYVEYAKKDAAGIVREDLLLTMSRRLNHVTKKMEEFGLVILKDEKGRYVARGNRNIKINGENMKPLLAEETARQDNVTVLNHVNITDYRLVEEHGRTVVRGAYGFDVNKPVFYEIHAKAVICAAGGAAGLYRPNNPGFSRHKMWYPPFNTGAGYAMGILAGAEMTTFEMRFIALRCKDTIAPTGTIAQGVGAKQVNARGEIYETKYGLTTSGRVYGTVMENRAGRGPCYLRTTGISKEQEQDLYKAYLNMAPSQTLRWLECGKGPVEENVEIEGTEPYIVGGHTASGYWVNADRSTTVPGLFAAGDVAGGCPQKYVTGALAEGEIAAEAVLRYLAQEDAESEDREQNGREQREKEQNDREYKDRGPSADGTEPGIPNDAQEKKAEYEAFLAGEESGFSAEQLEEAMQKIMDEYAGGIHTDYRYNEERLAIAAKKIRELMPLLYKLHAGDMDDLLRIYEVRERLIVCQAVIAHLAARKETRWHSFGENTDYPEKSEKWRKFVNSRMVDGEIQIIYRNLKNGGICHEHTDSEG